MKKLRPCLSAALMLVSLSAHATSFDCNKGRSPTERMICDDPALSTLDDTLGQLYWKARRRVVNRRAFLNDSDSKWAWREANCRDAVCLSRWYATRIEELQRLNASLQTGTQPDLKSMAASAMKIAPAAASASGASGASSAVTAAIAASTSSAVTAAAAAASTTPPTAADTRLNPSLASAPTTATMTRQCTAANPGIVVNDQCATVLREHGSRWKYTPHGSDWFCGVATLEPAAPTEVAAAAAP
ncbi:lysozyme inhibitor LprI family protein [Paraburkholderia bryophila]|jgi:uncharacterized protein|uniref:YARHG domain-containing protein n=1 Tax=Paraburkholderia bryophila TaxID=420952 RepID=A0A329CYW0_9BURK|nr:hypothetical protein [Paraburkholderia bryophila]RAS39192.1 hypothetical protein BX591_101529 [Paraburkholderia bryophila]